MKKFKFSLEALLRIRSMKERQALMQVAAVQSRINSFQVEIDKLWQEFDRNQDVYNSDMKHTFRPEAASMFNNYIQRLQSDEKYYREKMQELQPLLEEAQQNYREANAELKVVERLKERKFEEYMYEFNRELQHETDEINSHLYAAAEDEAPQLKYYERPPMRSELMDKQEATEQIEADFDEYKRAADKDAFSGFRGKGGRKR